MATQLITPNLDPYIYSDGKLITDWLGWCLAYVRSAFGTGFAGSTALEGWNKYALNKHADKNIPNGVYVPIFFNGYSNMGHAAIVYHNGNSWKMWSSPVSHKPYADVWTATSLDGLINIIKTRYSSTCNYLGWAEGLSGKLIINNTVALPQGDEMITNESQAHYAYQMLRPNGDGSAAEIAATAGKRTWAQFVVDAQPEVKLRNQNISSAYQTLTALQTQVSQLNSQVATLSKRPTQAELDAVKTMTTELQAEVQKAHEDAANAEAQLKEVQSQPRADEVALDTNSKVTTIFNYFLDRWSTFKDFFNRSK